jgi:hypothetical protein
MAALPVPASAQSQAKLRYVQVGADGAAARNLYDAQGVVVRDLEPGTVLAVHGERSGWLDVEAPGGFQVWVYGEFVTAANEPGLVRITGNGVRMRPLPSSGPESLPLRQHLYSGNEVRLIKRNDPSLALAKDWVQVWSPPGARAWVRAGETAALPAGAKGVQLWAGAVAAAERTAAEPTAGDVGVTAAAAPAVATAKETAQAGDRLAKADALLTAERQKDEQGSVPNYAVVLAAYDEVLAVVQQGPTADLARSRRQLAQSYADAYQIRVDLEAQRAALEAAAVRRAEEREKAGTRSPFEGRFEARGWVVREKIPGQKEPVWMVRWSGDPVAELLCSTGRYDLSLFEDYEVGIGGRVVRGPVAGSGQTTVRPRRIDVTRIEVISGRAH